MRVLRSAPRAFFSGARLPTRVTNGCTVTAFFKFGKNGANSQDAGIYNSITQRDDYDRIEMQNYFDYTGRLAVEGNYASFDRYEASGMHPAEVILLWACEEGDLPKVEELLSVGARMDVKDLNGKSPLELAANDAIKDVLRAAAAKQSA